MNPMKSGTERSTSKHPSLPAQRAPLLDGARSPGTLLPNDHLRLLIALLRPLGAELGRRWLAALLLVDEREREAVVAEIERVLAERAELGGGRTAELDHVSEERQRDGFTERTITTYSAGPPARERRRNRRAG